MSLDSQNQDSGDATFRGKVRQKKTVTKNIGVSTSRALLNVRRRKKMKLKPPEHGITLGVKKVTCTVFDGVKEDGSKALLMAFYKLRLPYEGDNIQEDTEYENRDPLFGIQFLTKKSIEVFQTWVDRLKEKSGELPE